MSDQSSVYAYIRRFYKVNPIVGQRVRHTVTGNVGTIIRPKDDPHYVRVRFDGNKHISNAHPTELEYDYEDVTA